MKKLFDKVVLGGNIFLYSNQKTVSELISKALNIGINKIDTADVYGGGISEIMIGKIISKYKREKFEIYSKAGTKKIDDANGLYTRKKLSKLIDDSLIRLKIDYIDIYQLHNFDNITPLEEIFDNLTEIKKEGKIKKFGISNFNNDQILLLHKKNILKKIHTNQVHFNIVNRENLKFSNKIKLIVYGVLGRGLLRNNLENSFRSSKSSNINNDRSSGEFKKIHKILRNFSKKTRSICDRFSVKIYIRSKKNI